MMIIPAAAAAAAAAVAATSVELLCRRNMVEVAGSVTML
jgi:hypothetical protein